MQVINNQLILRTKSPEAVQHNIPASDIVKVDENISTMLVQWDLPTAQQLAALKMRNIPSPIIRDYKWSGVHKPMAHQKTTAEFLTLNPRAFCFNEQGTGKTAACIWAADYLMNEGYVNKVLVVCPLSIMESAWGNDIFYFAPHRTVTIAYGNSEKRQSLISHETDFTIINYDGVNVVQDEIIKQDYDLIIIDEANAYKNASTKRWRVMKKILKEDTWLWMLTGTPAAQSPIDAHGIGKLCVPSNIHSSKMAFRNQVMYPVSKFKWVAKPNAQDIIYKTLQPAIRFSKEECLDLPDVSYIYREAPMTLQQKHYYKILQREFIIEAGDECVTSANAAVNFSKLLQLSGGVVYSNNKEIIEFDVSNRLKVIKEAIDESIGKVLIFAPFKHTIDLIDTYLQSEKITTEKITGTVPLNKRTSIFNTFQTNTDPRVLIIQPQTAAHGVTLTAASTIIWYSPITSTEYYLQANARINRKGQNNKMTIVHISGTPAEKKLYKLLSGRLEAHVKLLDLYQEIIQK